MKAVLDHLVVAARDLASGRVWLEEQLSLKLSPGGEHGRFGTHNLLLGLGDAYLELIAVNPDAPAPTRPRWFGLDTPEMWASLEHRPRLIHWVARVPDLDAALAMSPEEHGEALALSRGDLHWRLSVPPDGHLPMGGVLPSLIQWEGTNPSSRLPDVGARLEQLRLRTPDAAHVRAALDVLGLDEVSVGASTQTELRALIQTPGGLVELH